MKKSTFYSQLQQLNNAYRGELRKSSCPNCLLLLIFDKSDNCIYMHEEKPEVLVPLFKDIFNFKNWNFESKPMGWAKIGKSIDWRYTFSLESDSVIATISKEGEQVIIANNDNSIVNLLN